MRERRQVYLAFQGLLTAILLLFFLYERREVEGWVFKFPLLCAALFGILAALRFVSEKRLSSVPGQSALLIGDAVLASLTVHWSQNPQSDLYLAYFMIIFGAALTRKLAQCFIVAAVATVFYMCSAWTPMEGLPSDPGFWLRIPFLWVMAFIAAVLSQDASHARKEAEQGYQSQLLQMERLAAMGQLSGEVAHRIKGPLTSILVNAEVLQARPGTQELKEELEGIRTGALHCREILSGLLDLGRVEETVFQPLDLREPVRSALDMARPQLEKQGIRLHVSGLGRSFPILGDRTLLHEAVYAVVQNAIEAMPGGGALEVRLRPAHKKAWWSYPGDTLDFAELAVRDDGAGIDPMKKDRLFTPYFTTKGRKGHGLGLSAAQRILHNHSGYIEAFSDGPGKGARFVFSIPRFEKA
ncbi:MAG: HAMP domain-containing sensor histidine kinase [Elusimicrobiota bacterium]|jgi:signal transduction histidine kinase